MRAAMTSTLQDRANETEGERDWGRTSLGLDELTLRRGKFGIKSLKRVFSHKYSLQIHKRGFYT